MKRSREAWLGLGIAAALSGCGTAGVIKEDALAFSDATKQFTTTSRAFYGDLEARRRDYYTQVLVSAPGCKLKTPALLMPDRNQTGPGKNDPAQNKKLSLGWHCLDEETTDLYNECQVNKTLAGCETVAQVVELDLTKPDRSTALVLIEVISDYQAAIAKVVADPKFDAAEDIGKVLDKAKSASELIKKLGGDLPDPPDFTEQRDAVGTLIDLLGQAREDRKDLKKLRALMEKDDGAASQKFEKALDSLSARYRNLDKPLLHQLERSQSDLDLRLFNENIPPLAPDKRLARAKEIMATRAALEARANMPDPLASAFNALLTSNRQLRDAVVNRNYTPEQRRRIAESSLKQAKAWFDAVRSVIQVF